jgi:hypothetical protein
MSVLSCVFPRSKAVKHYEIIDQRTKKKTWYQTMVPRQLIFLSKIIVQISINNNYPGRGKTFQTLFKLRALTK